MKPEVEAVGARTCPVCGEPLPDRPARCFRCESPLARWWEFVDAAGGAPATTSAPHVVAAAVDAPPLDRPFHRGPYVVFSALVAGLLMGWWAARPAFAPSEPAAPRAAVATPVTVSPATETRVAPDPAVVSTVEPPAASRSSSAARSFSAARPSSTSASRSRVRYRVQPGDSPWRVSAALLGSGHRWRELWPEASTSAPVLRAGAVLDLEIP